MSNAVNRIALLADVRHMAKQISARLASENPWDYIEFDSLTDVELAAVKRMLHELLFNPPPRFDR